MFSRLLLIYEDIRKGIGKFILWRKECYEDRVAKSVAARNERAIAKLLRDIKAKRDKRRKQS